MLTYYKCFGSGIRRDEETLKILPFNFPSLQIAIQKLNKKLGNVIIKESRVMRGGL